MRLKTLLFLSFVLVFALGTANATTPVNGSYYMIDFTPSGYCDAFEFYTYGPSSTVTGDFNGTSGVHDLTTFCGESMNFSWGGFEVAISKTQPPSAGGTDKNDTDVSGNDIEQYYLFANTDAVTWVFDVEGTKKHPDTFAYYYEDGDGAVYVALEGPIEVDAYTPSQADAFKKTATQRALPLVGQSNLKDSVKKLN